MLYINPNIKSEIKYRLNELDIPCIGIAANPLLTDATRYHPDMAMVAVGDVLVASKHLGFEAGERLFITEGVRSPYPFDIGLNFWIDDRFAFGLEKHIDPILKGQLEAKNISIVNVNQGYARCSSILLKECLISADPSMISAASSMGYDVLGIDKGHVALEGYTHGFIGGASFVLAGNVYFFGSLDYHPDGLRIRDKIESLGYVTVELCDGVLTDYGSAVYFE